MMEEFLIAAVEYLRLSVEAVGAAVIGVGAVSTVFRYALSLLGLRKYSNVDIRLLNPTWAAVQTTALTIVVRKLITLSFNRIA